MIAVVFLATLNGPAILVLPVTLLIGWWPSAARLITTLNPGGGAAAALILAVVVFLLGSHQFCGWLYSKLRPEESAYPLKWPGRWTLCSFGMLLCTLLAIGSLMLTTHQLYWLSRGSDPVFADPFRENRAIMWTAVALQKSGESWNWDENKVRETFPGTDQSFVNRTAIESIEPIWIAGEPGKLRAIVLVPRHPLLRGRARIAVIEPGIKSFTRSLSELHQTLASFGIRSGPTANSAL